MAKPTPVHTPLWERVKKLEAELQAAKKKIARLESRGIEDMQDEIKQLRRLIGVVGGMRSLEFDDTTWIHGQLSSGDYEAIQRIAEEG